MTALAFSDVLRFFGLPSKSASPSVLESEHLNSKPNGNCEKMAKKTESKRICRECD